MTPGVLGAVRRADPANTGTAPPARHCWPPADRRAERAECAGAFGDGDAEDGFPGIAQLRAFGHEAQAIEVHVGPAEHGGKPGPLH